MKLGIGWLNKQSEMEFFTFSNHFKPGQRLQWSKILSTWVLGLCEMSWLSVLEQLLVVRYPHHKIHIHNHSWHYMVSFSRGHKVWTVPLSLEAVPPNQGRDTLEGQYEETCAASTNVMSVLWMNRALWFLVLLTMHIFICTFKNKISP